MRKSIKSRNLPETPVLDWMKAKDFRDNRLWSIRGGVMYTIVDGEEMTKDAFDRKFPVPNKIHFYRGAIDNPDKTKIYLHS